MYSQHTTGVSFSLDTFWLNRISNLLDRGSKKGKAKYHGLIRNKSTKDITTSTFFWGSKQNRCQKRNPCDPKYQTNCLIWRKVAC